MIVFTPGRYSTGMADLPQRDSGSPAPLKSPDLLCLHKPETASQHIVQFYDHDTAIVENVTYLVAHALNAGNSSVIVATDLHLAQIERGLEAQHLDLKALRAAGRYQTLDAAQTLSQFIVDGLPIKAEFDRTIGDAIRRAAEHSADGFVFAFGEMVGLLCAAGNPAGAVLLEQFWNALARHQKFSLYCAYSMSSLGPEPDVDALIKICAEHALTIPAEISR